VLILKETDLFSLIEKIYAAGLDPNLWQDCINELRDVLSGTKGFMYTFNSETQETTDFLVTSDFEPIWINKFLDYYIHVNPYPKPIHELAPAGVPLHDEMVLSRAEAHKTEYYNDWVKPQGFDVAQVGSKITIDTDSFVTFGTHVDPLTFEEKNIYYNTVLNTLIPHITRAIKINQVIKEQMQAQKNLHGIFDRLDLAILIIDKQHRIKTTNNLGENLLKRGDIILTDPHNHSLKAADKNSEKKLHLALDKCGQNKITSEHQTFCLTSTIDNKRYVTWAQFANQEHFHQFKNKTKQLNINEEEPLIAVLISLPQTHQSPPVNAVQSILAITSAEAKLAAALANGETLKSYAAQAKISHNTARGQLSSIFQKTGLNRQTELVSHIWRSFGPLRLK
jgi:DNA-binding CsgD family transcriptional regulator